tara:strand:+ start:3983 stop:4894 length:912 start_codon:yes stop_codon:yes gene_type:complete
MKDELIKILAACFLVTALSRCLTEKTKVPSRKTRETFRPFQPLAVVHPRTYEEVIKEAFKRMSSGESVPNIDCELKMDINPEDSTSLTKYIVNNLKSTINTLPTPTKVAPMIGEDFAVLDLSGFISTNDVAVVTFTLFHRRRYFGIQCRAIATRGSDKVGKIPWFIHKIHYAQEDPNPTEYKVTGVRKNQNLRGSYIENFDMPSLEEVTYPKELEGVLSRLSNVPNDKPALIGLGTQRLVVEEGNVDLSLASGSAGTFAGRGAGTFAGVGGLNGLIEGNPIMFMESEDHEISKASKPSDVILR